MYPLSVIVFIPNNSSIAVNQCLIEKLFFYIETIMTDSFTIIEQKTKLNFIMDGIFCLTFLLINCTVSFNH